MNEQDKKNWGTLLHVAGLTSYFIPILGGPLCIYLLWQGQAAKNSFLRDSGRRALNFQCTISLVALLLFAALYSAGAFEGFQLRSGRFALIYFFIIAHLCLTFWGTAQAAMGKLPKYYVTIPFFRA